VPNRRRRKLSTAISAVSALAVASPCAYFLVYESTSSAKAPEHHEFKQAAVMTDLPNELIGALSQGLSSFGINLPPVPALGGAGGGTGLTSPGLTSPGLGTTPGLASPSLTSPGLTSPGLTSPGLTSPGLTTPGTALPSTAAGGLTNPALTSPGLASPSEVPITTPTGLDPGADGTYPILGDPSSLGGGAGGGSGGSGGLVNDVMQAANQLGATQAIDLIKGLIMPAIAQAQGGGLPGAAGALPGALPGAAGALPGAAGALPGAAKALPGAAGALPGAAKALPGAAAAPALAAPPVAALPGT
jgi:hypothetical protein